MNDNAKDSVRPTSPLDRFVRRLRSAANDALNPLECNELCGEAADKLVAYFDLMTEQDDRIGELQDEIERLRKDAERYRWLRDQHNNRADVIYVAYDDTMIEDAAGIDEETINLDAAVDTLMVLTPNTGVKRPAGREDL